MDKKEIKLCKLSVNCSGNNVVAIIYRNHTIDCLYIDSSLDSGIVIDDDAVLNITRSLNIIGRCVPNSEANNANDTGMIAVIGDGVNTINISEGANDRENY